MSLDVYLTVDEPVPRESSGIFIRENGQTKEITRDEWDERNPGHEPVIAPHCNQTNEVFEANITHNLTTMADAAGLYRPMWRPDEIGITKAEQLIAPLSDGLMALKDDPARFQKFNPENRWGSYDGLVSFVESYLRACQENPTARVSVSR